MTPREQMQRLGIDLPAMTPKGQYGLASVIRNVICVSSQGGAAGTNSRASALSYRLRRLDAYRTVGGDVSIEEARDSSAGCDQPARRLGADIGSVDHISSLIKLTVYSRRRRRRRRRRRLH